MTIYKATETDTRGWEPWEEASCCWRKQEQTEFILEFLNSQQQKFVLIYTPTAFNISLSSPA